MHVFSPTLAAGWATPGVRTAAPLPVADDGLWKVLLPWVALLPGPPAKQRARHLVNGRVAEVGRSRYS